VYIYSDRVTGNELLRLLRRTVVVVADRGKGGHVMVTLAGRRTFVPTGTRELRPDTLHAILRDLAVTVDSLRWR
jgi:hypothetical protein